MDHEGNVIDYKSTMGIKGRIMALFNRYTIKEVTGITTALSEDMAASIELWADMMQHAAPWNTEDNIPSSGVIEAIAGALSDPVAEEMEVTAPSNPILDAVMKKLNERSTELVQNLALCGSSLIRPIYSGNQKLQFEIIRLGNYIPLAYDFDGQLIKAIILKQFDNSNKHYILLEKHEYKDRKHTVTMELYEILASKTLKKTVLTACPQTAGLTASYTWKEVDRPMIIEVRNRKPNNIDGSQVPCAIYSGNENLIEDADRQYLRMNWEQESAERKVFADEDLFTKRLNAKGSAEAGTKVIFGKRLKKLFVKTNGNGVGEEKITTFNPELRTEGQTAAFQQILRRLELACNIGKGTLSDLADVAQTATQYTGGKKALYTMVDSIESELEEKYKECAYVFAYMASAYVKNEDGIEYPFNSDLEITFNDTSRKDPVQMKAEALQELSAGVLNKWEYRKMFYGEDEETAKLNTPETETGGFVL